MSKVNLQDSPIIIGTPIEIENAVNQIRVALATLTWVDYPFFIAQRFFKLKGTKAFFYPETYAPSKPGSRNYHTLTPDNDYKGMFFFMVGTGVPDYSASEYNFITYPVGIIFSVNLDLIDSVKLDNGIFTQDLIKESRRKLTTQQIPLGLDYTILSETRDIREVYTEFTLMDLDTYNRAPQQCFRFNLSVTIQEDC